MEVLGDLLFELSNDERLSILLKLSEEPMRPTRLSNDLGLKIQAISRHLSRLDEVGLTLKGVDGTFRLTPFGELALRQLIEWEFMSQHRAYFTTHSSAHLPQESVKQIGDLMKGQYLDSVMDFLRCIETIINEADEYVWFQIDQYPVNALKNVQDAIDHGVRFRCIEPYELVSGPILSMFMPGEEEGLRRAWSTPLAEQRTLESIDVFIFLSEKRCVLAFPSPDGEFDYRGFTADDERSLNWCKSLFEHYWETAEPRIYISPTEYIRPTRIRKPEVETFERVTVVGRDDASVDAQAVQDAVDNYDEVILRGTFNFGTSKIIISRSVVIRGEGRENDVPSTKIYKKGWTFPLIRPSNFPLEERDHVFLVNGEGADVSLENVYFTDFNCMCICGIRGNSMTIRNNRITLETGLGRGENYPSWGDIIVGIHQERSFPGGVVIEGNYLDFALSRMFGGYILSGPKEDPSYRPNLVNHEYYIGVGICTMRARGRVVIENNVVRNMNTTGIAATEGTTSADVIIRNNRVTSELYGSYWYDPRWAGYGILANPGWYSPGPGFHVEITGNTIKYVKDHYCGIALLGPEFSPVKGTGKLIGGIVKNNKIHQDNGSVGIFVESCDGFEIAGNVLSGKAYFGIGIFPRSDPQQTMLGAYENIIEDNDMRGFEIKDSDENSKSVFDERTYAGSKAGSATAHIWLNVNTKRNVVKVSSGETVIDEGEDNTIIHEEDEE
ncbi:MAG: DUF1724 domain-containing protein [Thermoplasmata archaeon]|nr:MAG: DUF1724 domain-containing protein [Thermoplasmata archaeon]